MPLKAVGEVEPIMTDESTIDHQVACYSSRTPSFDGKALKWRRLAGHQGGSQIVPLPGHVSIMQNPRADQLKPFRSALVAPS